jgi:hypothetical protein
MSIYLCVADYVIASTCDPILNRGDPDKAELDVRSFKKGEAEAALRLTLRQRKASSPTRLNRLC